MQVTCIVQTNSQTLKVLMLPRMGLLNTILLDNLLGRIYLLWLTPNQERVQVFPISLKADLMLCLVLEKDAQ